MYISLLAPSRPPSALTAEKTSNSLSLSWVPPSVESHNGVIRRYVIRITEEETSAVMLHYSNSSQVTVEDLHPYYTYMCAVAAETVEVGPYTTNIIIQLDEDSMKILEIW